MVSGCSGTSRRRGEKAEGTWLLDSSRVKSRGCYICGAQTGRTRALSRGIAAISMSCMSHIFRCTDHCVLRMCPSGLRGSTQARIAQAARVRTPSSVLFYFFLSPPLFLFFHPFFPSLPADAPIGSAPDQRYSFSTLLPASATAPDGSTPRYSSFFFLRAPLRPNLIRGTPFFLLTRYPTRWFDSFLARI